MDGKKPYIAIFAVQSIYAGISILSKAAFNGGMNTSVFVFYRQAVATVFLAPFAIAFERKTAQPLSLKMLIKIFILALIGITIAMNLYTMGIKYTSATVAIAATNTVPVITFFLAVLFRMETIKVRSVAGIAKIIGVSLCLAGILVIAFYKGPHLKSLNHHHPILHGSNDNHRSTDSKENWIKGSFILIFSTTSWSLWIVLQGIFAAGIGTYLQSWCIDKKGPVFMAMSTPLTLVITLACASFLLVEIINLGSVLGGLLMVGGLYSVMWGKSCERKDGKLDVEGGSDQPDVHPTLELATPVRPLRLNGH